MANTDKLVELIDKLKAEAGSEPLVINFADSNHAAGKAQETVANPAILDSLKKANIKNLVLEIAPTDGLQELYTELKSKVSANRNYSSADYIKDNNIDPTRSSAFGIHFLDLLIGSAKQGMELSFPDNASVKGSAGEISYSAQEVLNFLQYNSSIITKGNAHCIKPVFTKLSEKIPQSHLRDSIEEITIKRMGDKAPADEPVIEAVNKKTNAGKDVAVIYGMAHFIGENDLNDGQQAKHKPVILIATDNDLTIFSSHYEQAKQLPQYRYNPETGEVSEFNIGQVQAVKLAKAMGSASIKREGLLIAPVDAPKKLTEDQCRALVPEDLRFKNYSPVDVFFMNLVDMITPAFLNSGNGVGSQSSKNSSPSH